MTTNNPNQPSDETAYLLSTQENRKKLLQAIQRAQQPENLVVISPKEWYEKYHI